MKMLHETSGEKLEGAAESTFPVVTSVKRVLQASLLIRNYTREVAGNRENRAGTCSVLHFL